MSMDDSYNAIKHSIFHYHLVKILRNKPIAKVSRKMFHSRSLTPHVHLRDLWYILRFNYVLLYCNIWKSDSIDRRIGGQNKTDRQYAISQLRIVRSDLHLVTYLDVGNFCDKSTEITLHEICVQVFRRLSNSSKPRQYVSLIYELAWLAEIRKSEENLLKT